MATVLLGSLDHFIVFLSFTPESVYDSIYDILETVRVAESRPLNIFKHSSGNDLVEPYTKRIVNN